MILKLTIKKKWFNMILSGNKVVEYRELKTYWVRRLYDYDFFKVDAEEFLTLILKHNRQACICIKDITKIQFFNGAYCSDKLPNFMVDFDNLYVGKGVENWGAEKDKEYFCLCFKNVHNRVNC